MLPTPTASPQSSSPPLSKDLPRAARIDSALSSHTVGGSRSPAKLRAWRITPSTTFEPAPFNSGPPKSETEVEDYLSSAYDAGNTKDCTRLFRIEPKHSHASVSSHTGDLKILLDHVRPFRSLNKVLDAFQHDGSDSYIGKAGIHFSPAAPLPGDAFELCCLLKYVEPNTRALVPVEEGRESFAEVCRWSIRQMAYYQSFHLSLAFETALFLNPSTECWQNIRAEMKDAGQKPYESWMRMSLIVFASLSTNWPIYIAALHRAVEDVNKDASFTDPKRQRVDEADTRSLEKCVGLMDRLQQASHVLENNIRVLEAALREAKRRQVPDPTPAINYDFLRFESGVEDVKRELEFHRNQTGLVIGRLERTSATISTLIALRGSFNMERMTARSILEARAVRIIALVTLCFLPPTFVSGLLDMNSLEIKRSGSGLIVKANAEFFFFLAVTIPLTAVTVGGWLIWDWTSMRKARRERPLALE